MTHRDSTTCAIGQWGALLLLFTLMGCAAGESTAGTTPDTAPTPSPRPAQDVFAEETRAEAARLRAEVASAKIAIAKQQAELQSARQELETLREREDAGVKALQDATLQVQSLEQGRDRLKKENAELKVRTNAQPTFDGLALEMNAIRNTIDELAVTLKTLTSDVLAIKRAMHRQGNAQASPKTTTLSAFSVTRATPDGTIVVQPGDTLWGLATTHRLSVDELKALNELDSTLIHTGQVLRVSEAPADTPRESPITP